MKIKSLKVLLLIPIKSFIHSRLLQLLYYRYRQTNSNSNYFISMVDERGIYDVGLADKIKGLLSGFYYCEYDKKRIFKIHFTHPFILSDYLMPNHYNWKIDEEEIAYNQSAVPIKLSFDKRFPRLKYLSLIKRLSNDKKQIHCYTNAAFYDHPKEIGRLFNILFKPTLELDAKINQCRNNLSECYCSITFRFQQLLGDFNEGNYPVLESENEKKRYIDESLIIIENLYNTNKYTKILVTADSSRFLEVANKTFDFVYVIPGIVKHPLSNIRNFDYSKSFIDLFLISEAQEIFRVVGGKLYASGFPLFAASMKGKVMKDIEINL